MADLKRLVHDAVMVCCICHEGPEDSTMHGGGMQQCPVCLLAAALRSTEQEPVAWMVQVWDSDGRLMFEDSTKLKAAADVWAAYWDARGYRTSVRPLGYLDSKGEG